MPKSNLDMIRKLQIALNSKGLKVLVNRKQFYSDQQNRPVTVYKVALSIFDNETGRYSTEEIFSSASQIQIVLFMRNFWNLVNDRPIPPTNGIKGAKQFEERWKTFEEDWRIKQTKK